MVLSRNKIAYYFYSLIVYFSYIQNVNVISSDIKWIINKLFYVLVVSFIFIFFKNFQKINKMEFLSILFLFLFLFFFLVSNLYVFTIKDALTNIMSNGVLYFLTFLVFLISKNILALKEMLKPFVMSSFIIVFLSILMYFGLNIPYYLDDAEALDMYLNIKDSNQLVGFSGVYLNQNSLSATLLVAVGVVISFYNQYIFEKKKIIFKVALIINLVLIFLLLLLTISRAAILAAAILIIIYFSKGIRSKKMFLTSIFASIFAVIAGLYFINVFNFLLERVQNDGSSFRTLIWKDALTVFKDNYLFGVGVYRYETLHSSWSAHNIYIQRLVGSGILSALFWFSWLLLGLVYSIKIIFLTSFVQNKRILVLCCCFISILVHQCFEAMISNTFAPITLAVFLIISLVLDKKNQIKYS